MNVSTEQTDQMGQVYNHFVFPALLSVSHNNNSVEMVLKITAKIVLGIVAKSSQKSSS